MNALALLIALSVPCTTKVDDRDHWRGGFSLGVGGGWGYRPYYAQPYYGYYNPYPYYYPYPTTPYVAPVAPVVPAPAPYYYPGYTYPYGYSPGVGLSIGWGGHRR